MIPLIVNYGLLSWSAPGLNAEPNPWLAFLGSYLGVLGAVSIAVFNNIAQRDKDKKAGNKNFRNFVVMTEFQASLRLENVIMNEHSRLIETSAYKTLLDLDVHRDLTGPFLKLTHFGNSPLIFDC